MKKNKFDNYLKNDIENQISINKTKNKNYVKFQNMLQSKYLKITILTIIIIFSFSIRINHIEADSMWIDETISSTAAMMIIEKGVPEYDSGFYYHRSIFFHYLMAFFIYNIGGDMGARFISILFGTLTVLLAFFFGNLFFKKKLTPYIFAGLIAVSSLEIIYSKQARFYQALQFFYYFSIFLFYYIIIHKNTIMKKRIWGYLLLIFSLYLTAQLHDFGMLLLPMLTTIYIIENQHNIFKKHYFKKPITYIAIFSILIIIGFFIYNLRQHLYIDENLIINYFGLYASYLTYSLPFIILAGIGIVISLKDNLKQNTMLLFLTIIPAISILFVKFFATRYLYFAVFAIFFYIAYVFEKIKFRIPIFIAMIILFNGTVFSPLGIEKPNLDFTMPIANYKDAYKHVLENYPDTQIATNWPAAGLWYMNKNPDYWIEFSVDGTSSDWMRHNQREFTTNAIIAKNSSILPNEIIIVLDSMIAGKLKQEFASFINTNCNTTFTEYNIEVFYCIKNKSNY